jgi:hypothetical protein
MEMLLDLSPVLTTEQQAKTERTQKIYHNAQLQARSPELSESDCLIVDISTPGIDGFERGIAWPKANAETTRQLGLAEPKYTHSRLFLSAVALYHL